MNNLMIDKDYLINITKKLLTTPSPTGFCKNIMNIIDEEVSSMGYQLEKTKKGNGHIFIKGKTDYTVAIASHVDTLGAMVRSITNDGKIKLTSIGGFTMNSIENEYVTIHTRKGSKFNGTVLINEPSVHVSRDSGKVERIEKNMEIRLDERVSSKEDVEKLGIFPGDFISLDPRTKYFENGYLKSRHLDDKASAGIILAFLKMLKENNIELSCNLFVLFSTYEEVGHGATSLPDGIDEFLALDMGAMGDDLSTLEHQVSICAKDSSGPYDYDMVTKLIELARDNELDFAVDIYPHYGSDVSAALRAGNDIKGALIGPGVHASHSIERTHIDGMINTLKLLFLYLLN